MFYRNIIIVLFLVLSFLGCDRNEYVSCSRHNVCVDSLLNVCVASDVPGYVVVGGERYGYSYGLLKAYADSMGYRLSLSTDVVSPDVVRHVGAGRFDVGLMIGCGHAKGVTSMTLSTTHYVLLGMAPPVEGSLSATVGNGTVMMPWGFRSTRGYDMLLDTLRRAELFFSPKDCYELVDGLTDGQFDFLVCEANEAQFVMKLMKDVRLIYEFREKVVVDIVFNSSDNQLYGDFKKWMDGYVQTDDYKYVCDEYSVREAIAAAKQLKRNNGIVGGISIWDDVMRQVGEEEGIDWRLLSAIAYNESGFRQNVRSGAGAHGIMQIMPITARHFGVKNSQLSDPKVNITVAAKLLKEMDESIGFGDNVLPVDRFSIVLAAYNCGIGTIRSARRLAAAEGENPDAWDDVSHCLELLGDNNFTSDVVKFRRFRGADETLAFVDKVIERYALYCCNVE